MAAGRMSPALGAERHISTGKDATMTDSKTWTTHSQTSSEVRPLDDSDPLSWILGFPSSEVLFLNDIFGRKALHCRDARRDRFRELVPLGVLDGTGHARGHRQRGGGLVFELLDETHPPLRDLCATFTRQASVPVFGDSYVSPPAARGSAPERQMHDSFFLQVAGSRRWWLYDAELEVPALRPTIREPALASARPAVEFTLTPGDVLYMPRGLPRAVDSCEGTSVHVEVGLVPYTWYELLQECLEETAATSTPWRETLPFGFGVQAESNFAPILETFRQRLLALPSEVDPEAILRGRLDEFE